jgi:hypothetical protein
MGEIRLVDSHKGVAWNRQLDWMIANKPKVTWLLFQTEQLVSYLDMFVAHVVEFRAGIIMRTGKSKEEAEEHIALNVLPFELRKMDKGEPLSETQVLQIKDYVENLDPSETVLDVALNYAEAMRT